MMERYCDFQPSAFDSRSNFMAFDADALESIEEWFVLPCSRNRDSDCLTESNFAVALEMLGGESETVQVHRFGHWACGWYEIIVVKPETDAAKKAEEIEKSLDDYPVLDDEDFSERESKAADETWKNCYSNEERIAFIREHRDEFEFFDFADLMAQVRGEYYRGLTERML